MVNSKKEKRKRLTPAQTLAIRRAYKNDGRFFSTIDLRVTRSLIDMGLASYFDNPRERLRLTKEGYFTFFFFDILSREDRRFMVERDLLIYPSYLWFTEEEVSAIRDA